MLDLSDAWDEHDPTYLLKLEVIKKHNLPHEFGSVNLVVSKDQSENISFRNALYEIEWAIVAAEFAVALDPVMRQVPQATDDSVRKLTLLKALKQWLDPFVPGGLDSYSPETLAFMKEEGERRLAKARKTGRLTVQKIPPE